MRSFPTLYFWIVVWHKSWPVQSPSYWNNVLNPLAMVAKATATYQGQVLKIKQVWYPVARHPPVAMDLCPSPGTGVRVYTKTRWRDTKHLACAPRCHKLPSDLFVLQKTDSGLGVEKEVRVKFDIRGGHSEGPWLTVWSLALLTVHRRKLPASIPLPTPPHTHSHVMLIAMMLFLTCFSNRQSIYSCCPPHYCCASL